MNNNQKAFAVVLGLSVIYTLALNLKLFLEWREKFKVEYLMRGNLKEFRDKLLAEEGLTNGVPTNS